MTFWRSMGSKRYNGGRRIYQRYFLEKDVEKSRTAAARTFDLSEKKKEALARKTLEGMKK